MPNYAMRLDTTPTCMWYHHQQGRHLKMQQKHHITFILNTKYSITSTGYKYPTTYDARTYDTLYT